MNPLDLFVPIVFDANPFHQRVRFYTLIANVVQLVRTGPTRMPAQPQLLEDLAETFVAANERLGDKVDGFLILIDEADKGARSSQLGEFIKMFTERLTKRDCHRVSIGLAGISDVVDSLRESHESSVRVLNHLRLDVLHHNERLFVVQTSVSHFWVGGEE